MFFYYIRIAVYYFTNHKIRNYLNRIVQVQSTICWSDQPSKNEVNQNDSKGQWWCSGKHTCISPLRTVYSAEP